MVVEQILYEVSDGIATTRPQFLLPGANHKPGGAH